jgi:uncharacterized protein (DUF1499 family)
MMPKIAFYVAFLPCCLLALGAVGAQASPRVLAEGTLACPPTPNCVNSLESSSLPPLSFQGEPAQGMAQLKATLATFADATIERSDALSLVAIFTTRLGFRDEVEFRIDGVTQTIHYRSRSLTGLYDFGKNRSRMQDVKTRFDALR